MIVAGGRARPLQAIADGGLFRLGVPAERRCIRACFSCYPNNAQVTYPLTASTVFVTTALFFAAAHNYPTWYDVPQYLYFLILLPSCLMFLLGTGVDTVIYLRNRRLAAGDPLNYV